MLVVAALLEELCTNYCRNSWASWKGARDTDDSDILSMSAAGNPQTTSQIIITNEKGRVSQDEIDHMAQRAEDIVLKASPTKPD